MISSTLRFLCRAFGMTLLAVLLLAFPACSNRPPKETETTPATAAPTSPTETLKETDSPTTPVEEETSAPETTPAAPEYIDLSVYKKEDAGAKTNTVLRAADYGVKGDGVTDDGPAISAAVRDAVKKQATLQFEAGKTYLILSADNTAAVFKSPFAMQGADGVTVDGGGSVFKVAPGISYFAINGCESIRLCNMKLDMTVSPYLVGTVKSVSGHTVTFATDMEPYADSYDYSRITAFSIAYNEGIQNRPHRFLSAMKKTASCEVQVTYNDAPGYTVGNKVFIPNPGIGHVYSESIYIGNNRGSMTFENIELRAASSFVCAIKGNDAEIYFENFDLVPGEENNREIKMVSWRDGFHCKDNRRPFHWHECDVGVLFDDVYNISGTLGHITEIANDGCVTVVNDEFFQRGQYVGFDCRPGDVVDIYDPAHGIFCGTATVRKVLGNPDGSTTIIFGYGESVSKMREGYKIGNRETCAPGSTITDCRFTGTYRFLRNIRVERTVFEHLRTWIKVEGGVEGPLPGNMDFVDCTFIGGGIELGATGGRIAQKITDIGFWNCTFEGTAHEFDRAADVTIADTWTEADLFTVRNRKLVPVAVEITPNELDAENGVTYDWTNYTMSVEGGRILAVADIPDAAIRAQLESSDHVASHVLVLTGTEENAFFTLGGLDKTHFSALHKKNAFHVLTVYYLTTAADTAAIGDICAMAGKDLISLCPGAFAERGQVARTAALYDGADENEGICLNVPAGVTVYIGYIGVETASAVNPTEEQLEEGHTFLWSNHKGSEVTIGENGKALRIDEISDEAVKKAIQGAKSGFNSGMVLHLTQDFGSFTGLTDPSYYKPGTTYHISLDAFVASAMKPANGTKIYLLAMDETPGNRVLAEGLFTNEGFYHFEMDWTVGNTGESSLKFYVSNTPAAYPDVYIGDFTITKAKPQKPALFLTRDDYHTLTADEIKAGYTFDFTEGNLLNTGNASYASTATLRADTAELLRENGFGDTVYYCNQNFRLESLPDNLTGGGRLRITMQVYDTLGNLATSGGRGVFVMLHMQGGVQNSAEVNYRVKKSDVDPRLLTITFESTPPAGTDDLIFYSLSNMEFFIGSVTVEKS